MNYDTFKLIHSELIMSVQYILDSRRTHNEVGTSTPRVSYI